MKRQRLDTLRVNIMKIETDVVVTESTYVDTDSFQQDKAQMYNEFDEDNVQQAKTKLMILMKILFSKLIQS